MLEALQRQARILRGVRRLAAGLGFTRDPGGGGRGGARSQSSSSQLAHTTAASRFGYFEAPWFLRIDRSLPLDLVRANITGLGETSPNPLAGSLGTRGACCRKGDKNDPPECARASFAYSGYHECVLPRVMGSSLGC